MKTKNALPRHSSPRRRIPKTHAALALILIGLSPAIANGQDNPPRPEVIEAKTRSHEAAQEASAHKADLEALDRRIEAIEAKISEAPEGPEREEARQRLDALKERRSELRKAYLSSKYEKLKADVETEYEKIAAWTREKYRNVKESITGPEPDTPAQFHALMNPKANAALANIAVYQANPSPENKAEVKQALKELEAEIDRLEAHAETLPKGEQRTTLERRINAIEDRKDDLEHDFTKARWDALINDLKREWNELIH